MQRKKRHGFSMVLAGALALAGLFALTAAILLRPEKRLSIPEPVQATEAPAEEVYTTPSGKKYHRESCASLKNSENLKTWTPEAAREAGYTPCKSCDP